MPRNPDRISDPIESGIAKMRQLQGVSRTEGFRLTDVDGIGPSTAENLKAAGVERPEDLTRVTPDQLEMIDGIGPATAEKLAAKFQYGQTRFERPRDDSDLEEAREANAERSPEARAADRGYNAPITTDVDRWKRNKGELDYPGVDTVPEQRRAERVEEKAKRLREKGGVDRVEPGEIPGRVGGKMSGGMIQVDTADSFDPVSTVAHELGHAVSRSDVGPDVYHGNDDDGGGFFEDEEVREEAEELAVRRRPMATSAESIEKTYDERDYEEEIFADAFAVAVEEPRTAKRKAPNLFRKLQNETVRDLGRF